MNQGSIAQALKAVMPAIRASGLLVSRCTIQRPSGNQSSSGAPDGLYVPITGLINIACTSPPSASAKGMPAAEVRGPADTFATQPHHVLLDSYYPAVQDAWLGTATQEGGAIATVDGIDYTIIAVEHDSQGQMTRIEIRLGKI